MGREYGQRTGWALTIEMPRICDHLSSVNRGISMIGYSTTDKPNEDVGEAALAAYQRGTLLRVQIPLGSKVPVRLIWEVSEQPPAMQALFFVHLRLFLAFHSEVEKSAKLNLKCRIGMSRFVPVVRPF